MCSGSGSSAKLSHYHSLSEGCAGHAASIKSRAMARWVLIALLATAPAFAEKKTKPPLPWACISQVCIENLKWTQDYADSPSDSRAMSIFGALENSSQYTLSNITVIFTLLGSDGSIVRTAEAYLVASIPPGGKWAFKAHVNYRGMWQLVMDDVLMTNAAELRCLVSTNPPQFTDTPFKFPTVFNGFESRFAKKWLKEHPE